MRERVDLKSPVREYRPPGSVRGAPGNRRPYLDKAEIGGRRARGSSECGMRNAEWAQWGMVTAEIGKQKTEIGNGPADWRGRECKRVERKRQPGGRPEWITLKRATLNHGNPARQSRNRIFDGHRYDEHSKDGGWRLSNLEL